MTEELFVARETLREQVREKYRVVAVDPHVVHRFHTGRPLARKLGYDTAIIDALPDRAVESFVSARTRPSSASPEQPDRIDRAGVIPGLLVPGVVSGVVRRIVYIWRHRVPRQPTEPTW